MVNVAVMGHGVVGSGVVEVILSHHEGIVRHAHDEINIKYVLDLKDFPDSPVADRFTKNFDDILNDPSVEIVVEVMGGLKPAFEFVHKCLCAGKSVVTSNKELVAAKGAELLAAAKEHNVNFLFEASVGGGIPIIRPISQCLAANSVLEIAGILNGTTNFILTKMIDERMSFEDALAIAQEKGYAERDPSADVEGHDACRKICILASLAFGKHVYPEQVYTEGITKISLSDVAFAREWGGEIKLIGDVKLMENGQIQILVCPMFVKNNNILASTDGVYNGIMVKGDAVGEALFYGKGAGKLPTASAVVADVIDCMKHREARKYLFWSDDAAPDYVQDHLDRVAAMYVRIEGAAVEAVEAQFGHTQWIVGKDVSPDERAFVTKKLSERIIREKLAQLEAQGVRVKNTIRIADFDSED